MGSSPRLELAVGVGLEFVAEFGHCVCWGLAWRQLVCLALDELAEVRAMAMGLVLAVAADADGRAKCEMRE